MFSTSPMRTLSIALVFIAVASPVWAQRKPAPPPWSSEPRASVVSDEFLQAYKAAGSPKLLVFTYIFALSEDEGDRLYEIGVAERFNQRLQHRFTHPDIALVNLHAAEVRNQEELDTLVRTDHVAAARILAQEAQADVVLFVILREQFGREDGTKYAALYVVWDYIRGQNIAAWSWDMKPDSDDGQMTARRLGKYATTISERIYRDMAIYFPKAAGGTTRRFTLRFTGVPDVGTAALRDSLLKIPGVVELLRINFSGASKSTLTTIDLKYRGQALDLAMAVRQSAEDVLDKDVWFNRSSEGVITLEARSKPLILEESLLSGDPPTAENAEHMHRLRERFAHAYNSKASPTIAVMINKAATQASQSTQTEEVVQASETETPTSAPADKTTRTGSGDGVKVVVTPHIYVQSHVKQGGSVSDSGGGGSISVSDTGDSQDELEGIKDMNDDDLLMTRAMEDRILARLGNLRVRLKDLEQTWRILAKEKAFQEEVWDNFQLSRLLGEKSGVDIVISGVGRVVRKEDSVGVQYTFRAYSVNTATILAAAPAQRVLHGSGDLDGISDSLAAEVVGKLAYQMMENWEPPSRIAIWVTNVSSVREVQKVADLLAAKVEGVLRAANNGFDSSTGEAIGYLEVDYDGQYEDLLRALDRQEGLPFDLENVSSNREHIKLKLTDKLP